MKIVVLVKHVADPDAKWRYTDDLTVDRAALEGRFPSSTSTRSSRPCRSSRRACRRRSPS